MDKTAKIQSIVFECLERVNEPLPAELRIPVSLETAIVGEGAQLDSLSLALFLVDVEENLQDLLGHLNIVDQGISAESGPQFNTVQQLIEWVAQRK